MIETRHYRLAGNTCNGEVTVTGMGSIWTLSSRAWGAVLAISIAVLGGWVGLSATQSVDSPPQAEASGSASGSSPAQGGNASGDPGANADESLLEATPAGQVSALTLVEPPLLGKTALEVLALLPVSAPDTGMEYQRTQQFGEAWLDVDANGCSTREDILLRDLSNTVLNGCKVMSGMVVDPYSGNVLQFVRGNDTSMLVQIDHIVALYNAWTSGAQHLTQDQRQRLANDPTNLLAVSEATNQAKGASDAATWLPPLTDVHCEYAARQISVKYAYQLSVTSAERDALAGVLRVCPEQPAYRSWLGAPSAALGFVSPQPVAAPTSSPAVPTDGSASVYYENCSAAHAAGASNLPVGAPGYRPELDRDLDGIACER